MASAFKLAFKKPDSDTNRSMARRRITFLSSFLAYILAYALFAMSFQGKLEKTVPKGNEIVDESFLSKKRTGKEYEPSATSDGYDTFSAW